MFWSSGAFCRRILDFWTIFEDSCVALTEKQTKGRWSFVSGNHWFWLNECESQQFLSFLRSLYSFYFSDWAEDEETRERFLNLCRFTPLPPFLTSILPSSLPRSLVWPHVNTQIPPDEQRRPRHALCAASHCSSANSVLWWIWHVWKLVTAENRKTTKIKKTLVVR